MPRSSTAPSSPADDWSRRDGGSRSPATDANASSSSSSSSSGAVAAVEEDDSPRTPPSDHARCSVPPLNGAETSSSECHRGGDDRADSDEHDDLAVPCLAATVVRRPRQTPAPSPTTNTATTTTTTSSSSAAAAAEDEALGGKLRFYLAGSCVLELRHDSDVGGRPKQWVQSWGKTFHPPAIVHPSSPSVSNAPWPPPKEPTESTSLEESQAEKISSTRTITPSLEVVRHKRKPLGGNYMISYVRRLGRSSHPQRKVLPSCLARKLARRPQHILNSGGDLVCQHGSSMTGCLERRPQKKRPSSTFLEKSRNVAAIIEELTGRGGAVERPSKRPSPSASTSAAAASASLMSDVRGESRQQQQQLPATEREGIGGAADAASRHHGPPPPGSGDDHSDDVKARPPADWFFDPNEAGAPVSEMIGYPQPSPGGRGGPSPKKRSGGAEESDRYAGTGVSPLTPPPSTTKRPRDRHSASPPPVPPELRFSGSTEHVSSLLHAAGLAMSAGGGADGSISGSPDASAVAKMLALLQEGAAERAAVLARIEALGCSPEAALQSLGYDDGGPDGLGCSKKKRKGGGYGRGRTIGEAVRAFVIGDILNLGGDVRTKYVPRGVFTEVASRYKIDATTTYRWWLKYCNGVRMASANAGHAESSHKSYLPANSTVGTSVSLANVSVAESKKRSESVSPHERTQSSKRSSNHHHRIDSNDHYRGAATDNNHHHHPHHQPKEHGRPSHSGGSHSPRSDDSASSGASLVDPAALYASSLALFPPPNGGAWPQNLPLPQLTNGQLPLNPASTLPLPVGVCLPYLWNYSALPAYVNGGLHSNQMMPSISGIKTEAASTSTDEPLDLTVPKKSTPSRSVSKMELGLRRDVVAESKVPIGQSPNFNPFMYRECQPDELILRTLLTVQEQQAVNTASLFRIESRHVAGKKNAKGTTNANGITHRNMKPKHYPFTSLQIGTFELHSKVPNEYISEREIFKENPNKFKVIFTQRKFVYEFETNSVMDPSHDAQQKEHPHSRRMACIVVPFSIVEAFWCYGSTIILRVISKPFMFLGQRLKQVGCVPSLTVYETKKSVDLTGGQLSQSHLHKVTLLKPHLVEQLKIYLVLFDVRFRNLMAPSIFPVLRLAAEQNNPPGKEIATN